MIRFQSTRGDPATVPLSTALVRGIAPDGGLYVAERLPRRAGNVAETPSANAPVSVKGDIGDISDGGHGFLRVRPLLSG